MINPVKEIKGKLIKLLSDNIDTDRIIPARYMKSITFESLGDYCFYDERFDTDGSKKNHPFNNIDKHNDYILLTGKNFGCGSSREHAPQSLKRAGIKAIIAESFAEIFFGNATTIGLPCVVLNATDIESISNSIKDDIELECKVDLINKCVYINNNEYRFSMPEDIRRSFINGTYDSLSILLENIELIKELESHLPYKIV